MIRSVVDGRYEVLSVLGEGGMGTVYRVRHTLLGRFFALKVLRSDLSREPDLSERFIREAKAAAAIAHPNVVQITDFGRLSTGQPYFVMDLLDGLPLSQLIRRAGPLPAAQALCIIRQVAEGLAAAHQAGIVHRDLKPDNVLVSGFTDASRVRVTVVDFGLAKVAGQSRLTRAGTVFGTPYYMSPEQAADGSVDCRSDMYALGIIMYECCTGQVPFEADSHMGVMTKHMYVEPVPPSEVLGGGLELGALEAVILRCLRKKPERRFQSMEELVRALDGIVRFTRDGRIRIQPLKESMRPPSVLAGELGVSTAEQLEVELARAGVPVRRGRCGAAGAAVALAGILGWAFWAASPKAGAVVDDPPSPRPAAARLPPARIAQEPQADEPPRLASDAGTTGVPASVFLGEAGEAGPAGPGARKPTERPAPAGPPARPSVPTPAPERPASVSNFGASEIVDPWPQ